MGAGDDAAPAGLSVASGGPRARGGPRRAARAGRRRGTAGDRRASRAGAGRRAEPRTNVLARARELLAALERPSLRRVINATGVILHTNLGRAPLAPAAREAVARAAEGYANLELDLATGERGSRHAHVEGLLCELTGAEAAIVVNNGAAAVLLAAAALAGRGAGIVVSRGQLVEIGGGFRIPEVIAQSGARMVEVGTTNRTRLADYERRCARRRPAGAILRVHPSNFRTVGFVEEVSIEALCELGVPVIDDVGSGVLADAAGIPALADEPALKRSIAAGAALVCCSGDKLLGGPQAGLLVGRARRGRRRAPAPAGPGAEDRQALAGRARGDADAVPRSRTGAREIPVLAMLDADEQTLAAERADWREAIGAERRGRPRRRQGRRRRAAAARARGSRGGAADARDPEALMRALRDGDPPVIARIHDGRVLLDPRTLTDEDRGRRRGGAQGAAVDRAEMSPGPLTLGTAGHIDHGKTALIRALTGVDTDRLPEEQRARDLDRARLRRPGAPVGPPAVGDRRPRPRAVRAHDGRRRDRDRPVPDDGRRRRRRDAADARARRGAARRSACRTGVVAVTKTDLADPELALLEAAELLPGRGDRGGVGAHRARARRAARRAGPRGRASAASAGRRRAAAPGCTSTACSRSGERARWSPGRCGRARSQRGDELVLLPAGRRARVRGVQVHDQPLDRAPAGQRVARQPDRHRGRRDRRGDVVVAGGATCGPTYLLDAELEFSRPRARARRPGPGPPRHPRDPGPPGLARRPLLAAPARAAADRRRRATAWWCARSRPPDTLGGGLVLDAHPRKHGPARDLLARLERLARGESRRTTEAGRRRRPATPARAPKTPAPEPLSASALALEERLREAGLEPPIDSELDAADLAALRDAGRAVRVSKALHYHPDALAEIRAPADRARRRPRRRGHARPAARRARHLAQVRPGAARALRLRARSRSAAATSTSCGAARSRERRALRRPPAARSDRRRRRWSARGPGSPR